MLDGTGCIDLSQRSAFLFQREGGTETVNPDPPPTHIEDATVPPLLILSAFPLSHFFFFLFLRLVPIGIFVEPVEVGFGAGYDEEGDEFGTS